jgi:hypothetical protein
VPFLPSVNVADLRLSDGRTNVSWRFQIPDTHLTRLAVARRFRSLHRLRRACDESSSWYATDHVVQIIALTFWVRTGAREVS